SFVAIQAYNQNLFVPESYLGIKLGGNLSRIDAKPTIPQELNFGFTGGITYKYISQKSLGIQLEINYMQVGWTESLDSPNSYSRRLDYIQIPFMTHVNTGKRKTKFVFNLGPYISFLVSEKEFPDLTDEAEEQDYYYESIDNNVEFGVCFGIGISQHTSIGLFQLEARVNQSLTNIFTSGFDSMFEYSRSQSVEVTLCYMLDFKSMKTK
ncbi:MAG: porin family protein, partial [Bacteroidota bacterium]|nr:porin family protein [Bacteroidota bacterium]